MVWYLLGSRSCESKCIYTRRVKKVTSAPHCQCTVGQSIASLIDLFPAISNAEHTFGDHVISSNSFSDGFIAVVQSAVSRMYVVDSQVGVIDHGVRRQEVNAVHDAAVDVDVIKVLVAVCRIACIARPHDSRRLRCVTGEYQGVTNRSIDAMIMVCTWRQTSFSMFGYRP